MPIIGKPRSYFKKFLFQLEISGVRYAGFQKAGPLKATVAVIEQWEGGAMAADKSPGRYKTENMTCERGATSDLDLWLWFKEVSDIAANGGAVDDQYKKDVDLVQLDRDGTELRRWTLHDAWPCEFEAGDWDNTADSNVIESLVLTYKYFDPLDDSGEQGLGGAGVDGG